LHRLRTREFGQTPTDRRVHVGAVSVAAGTVRHDDADRLDLSITVDLGTDGQPSLDNLIVDLDIDSVQHCLGAFDTTNCCRFADVPNGRWKLTLDERVPTPDGSRALPMPTPPAAEFALAATADSVVIMTTVLPAGQGLAVLSREQHGGHYSLEYVRILRQSVRVLGVRHGLRRNFVVVPMAPQAVGHASSSVRLDGFDTGQPWSVQPDLDPLTVAGLPIEIVTSSIRQCSPDTRPAWRELASLLPEPTAAHVRTELARLDDPSRS